MKYIIIYFVGLISALVIIALIAKGYFNIDIFHLNNYNKNKTNLIELTNYVEKIRPKYIPIQFTNVIVESNQVFIAVPIDDYSNLVVVIDRESNYTLSDIKAVISNNNYLILSHYQTTNVIKLPDLCKYKNNEVLVGYTLTKRFYTQYNRIFLNTDYFDIGAGVLGIAGTETIDIGVNGIIRF